MSSIIMQNFTFITFIVSEEIAMLKVFATPDNQLAGWPNSDQYTLIFFM